jgi:hypothetical protein
LKRWINILLVYLTALCFTQPNAIGQTISNKQYFNFYGDSIEIITPKNWHLQSPISSVAIADFYTQLNGSNYQPMIAAMLAYKQQQQLDDWLYYQLIRIVANGVSPKAANYQQYTLFKWFLLAKSGYATSVSITNTNKLLLYAQTNEPIYNIPYHLKGDKQYVCLNYHDYGEIDFDKEKAEHINIDVPEALNAFSYKINRLPNFKGASYTTKDVQFDYQQKDFHFKILVNKEIKQIFANYPVVDYECYFNIPISSITYNSLIPSLKEAVKGFNQKQGVDYLMRFTRYAFMFQPDKVAFGQEKRLSPEQTLLYDGSDCEDRAAFFFFLVREIYNLPMIALAYPEHVTIAVKFDKQMANPIVYKGNNYWVCEPTPQQKDLRLGQILPSLKHQTYDVVYEYSPSRLVK